MGRKNLFVTAQEFEKLHCPVVVHDIAVKFKKSEESQYLKEDEMWTVVKRGLSVAELKDTDESVSYIIDFMIVVSICRFSDIPVCSSPPGSY